LLHLSIYKPLISLSIMLRATSYSAGLPDCPHTVLRWRRPGSSNESTSRVSHSPSSRIMSYLFRNHARYRRRAWIHCVIPVEAWGATIVRPTQVVCALELPAQFLALSSETFALYGPHIKFRRRCMTTHTRRMNLLHLSLL
jgi:hypothetical protein